MDQAASILSEHTGLLARLESRDAILRDFVAGFLRGYTGPPEVAADELIRTVREWDGVGAAS